MNDVVVWVEDSGAKLMGLWKATHHDMWNPYRSFSTLRLEQRYTTNLANYLAHLKVRHGGGVPQQYILEFHRLDAFPARYNEVNALAQSSWWRVLDPGIINDLSEARLVMIARIYGGVGDDSELRQYVDGLGGRRSIPHHG
jgi:hypothetical protein